jgi:hypothetical protein
MFTWSKCLSPVMLKAGDSVAIQMWSSNKMNIIKNPYIYRHIYLYMYWGVAVMFTFDQLSAHIHAQSHW